VTNRNRIAAAGALLLCGLAFGCGSGGGTGGANIGGGLIAPGAVAPAIAASGWFNGPGPAAEDLKDQVVVVDFWASWCKPCREKAPEIVAAHRRFSTEGVVFLGLTSDDQDSLPDAEDFIGQAQIEWPNGYGQEAYATMEAFRVESIPTVYVIGRDGRVAWHNWSGQGDDLEVAIQQALDE
jgi:thiol-disulfide isomerase/thioredoxin